MGTGRSPTSARSRTSPRRSPKVSPRTGLRCHVDSTTPVVVQFDEPLLPAAIAGHLTGVTAFSPVAAIEETLATSMLDTCAAAAGAEVSVHCCGSGSAVESVAEEQLFVPYRWTPRRCRPPIWRRSLSSSTRGESSFWASSRPARRRDGRRSKRSPAPSWRSPTGSASRGRRCAIASGYAGVRSGRRHPAVGAHRYRTGPAGGAGVRRRS